MLDRTIYKTDRFYQAINEINGAVVVADISRDNLPVESFMAGLGGQVLPFAAVFPGGDLDNPILLHDSYSLDDILNALQTAGQRGGP